MLSNKKNLHLRKNLVLSKTPGTENPKDNQIKNLKKKNQKFKKMAVSILMAEVSKFQNNLYQLI